MGALTGRAEDEATLIVAVTEKRTREELDTYAHVVEEVLG